MAPERQKRSARSAATRYLSIGAGLGAAAVLLALAVPRGLVQVEILPTARAIPTMEREVALPGGQARIRSVAAAREAAARWVVQPATMKELALANLVLVRVASPDARPARLEASYAAAETSLTLRPLDAYSWYHYAQARRGLSAEPDAGSAAAVVRGFEVQRHNIRTSAAWLPLIMDHWRFFTREHQTALRRLFDEALTFHGPEMARLARNLQKRAFIYALFVKDTRQLARFAAFVAQDEAGRGKR